MFVSYVSPLRIPSNEREGEISTLGADEFSDGCSIGNLFDDIDLGDLFVGIDNGDVLPDLELDPELLAEFSVEGSDLNVSPGPKETEQRQEGEKGSNQREALVDQREESSTTENSTTTQKNSVSSEGYKGQKSSTTTQAKGTQGKKKVKVDWTPDLHRRFVQAVEQLGLDKAVPSRILELMGIDCLTRHNIASHLQKYRSHRKHLLAREAEAANWSQRRQMYIGGGSKSNMSPWLAPTMGFPPHAAIQPYRPLHVWGHPTVDQSPHLWPRHLIPSPISPPQPPWAASPPPPEPTYWQSPHPRVSRDGWVQNPLTQGAPCFPRPMITSRLSSPPVPGFPPHALYNKTDNSTSIPSARLDSHLPFDFHPSEETIDAAIGDVLAKPMLSLPLGLKPPSLESVMVELQRQGVSKIPPSSD
ncbi:hypothetical protein AAC387_Pa06g0308 [Persea americana]